MSIQAMRQALEALEECRRDPRLKYEHPFYDKTITSLRAAIETAEKQEPVGKFAQFQDGIWREVTVGSSGVLLYATPPAAQRQWLLADAIRAEPTEMIYKWRVLELVKEHAVAQRQWVGLTDEEISRQVFGVTEGAFFNAFNQGVKWAEATLKEKNT